MQSPALNAFIVEDSPVILDNLTAALEELTPVKVVGAAPDEASAIAWLEQPAVDCQLVIVDIFLKSGTGLGVLKTLQQSDFKGRRVVLTNYATPDMKDRCAALGAARVFDKSNELDELIDYCFRLARGDGTTAPGEL